MTNGITLVNGEQTTLKVKPICCDGAYAFRRRHFADNDS